MLTKIQVYSEWHSAVQLLLDPDGRAETDLIHIRNINGLDPVKASVNTSPLGSVDGSSYAGSSVENRNIVLTLRPNPDWKTWTYEALRQVIYQYFMPKRLVKMVLTTDEFPPMKISGVVESVDTNIFSKDPEMTVSIICPDPYFMSVNPVVFTGKTIPVGGASVPITYDGNVEAGIYLKIAAQAGQPDASNVTVKIQNPETTTLSVAAVVNPTTLFEMSTVPNNKFVQNIGIGSGATTNLLPVTTLVPAFQWPVMESGSNQLSVITNVGLHNWELDIYERFGGI